jgi:hypothetical protein
MKNDNVYKYFSIGAFMFSIIAFVVVFAKSKCWCWNDLNFLVAVLSILVVILMGWQIFSTLSFENKIEEKIEALEEKLKTEIKEIREETKNSVFLIGFEHYLNMLPYSEQTKNLYLQISTITGALFYGVNCGYSNDVIEEKLKDLSILLKEKIHKNTDAIRDFDTVLKQNLIRLINQSPKKIKILKKLKRILE